MLLINLETKKITSEYSFRREHKNTIFPSKLTDEMLAEYGYANFYDAEPPKYDSEVYNRLIELEPQLIDGKWTRQWKLEEIVRTEEEEKAYLDKLKKNKLNELESSFLTAEKNGVVKSSLGFDIDATERSNRDINGLIDVLESSSSESQSTMFCAADNSFYEVTLDQLKIMKIEVIQYGQELYQKKWTYREQINNANTKEEIDAIEIQF